MKSDGRMKKRFKARKRAKFNLLIVFILILVVVFFSLNVIRSVNPSFLLTGNYRLFNLDFNKQEFLLKSGLNFRYKSIQAETTKPVFSEVPSIPEVRKKVYIYNTHQKEEYADYNVYDGALALKDYLNEHNIDAIVEDTDITAEVHKNNYTYSQSYRVTKELILKHMSNDISLYIDLHRDSSNKNITTATIGEVSYAKMMFVVGGKHETYMENYRVAEELNKMIKNLNSSLSRGLLLRKSSSYNQEISGNILLIELGGPYNTKEEVNNSLKMLAQAISNYLEE